MLNYKFCIVRTAPRILVDLLALAGLLQHIERQQPEPHQPIEYAHWAAMSAPPFVIREAKPPSDGVKVSFRYTIAAAKPRATRVNVFQGGKINVLGADSECSAYHLHLFLSHIFATNWTHLVCLQPRRDVECDPSALLSRHMDRALVL
jgi:hypothetical protein